MDQGHLQDLRDNQAAMAAFFSACFLFLAGTPVNITPANSTVHVKIGRWPRPVLKVEYAGKVAPTLCETSCNRFLYTPVSSCKGQNGTALARNKEPNCSRNPKHII